MCVYVCACVCDWLYCILLCIAVLDKLLVIVNCSDNGQFEVMVRIYESEVLFVNASANM